MKTLWFNLYIDCGDYEVGAAYDSEAEAIAGRFHGQNCVATFSVEVPA